MQTGLSKLSRTDLRRTGPELIIQENIRIRILTLEFKKNADPKPTLEKTVELGGSRSYVFTFITQQSAHKRTLTKNVAKMFIIFFANNKAFIREAAKNKGFFLLPDH